MVDFTILPKVPFGPLGDIQVKTKAETNPKWYVLMTAIELAQMCGRCVRNEKDIGHTYIIDPSFWFHFERGFNYPFVKLLPPPFAERHRLVHGPMRKFLFGRGFAQWMVRRWRL